MKQEHNLDIKEEAVEIKSPTPEEVAFGLKSFRVGHPEEKLEAEYDFSGYERKEFSVWKTIKVGTGEKTGDDFINTSEANGYFISDDAEYILREIKIEQDQKELNLVKVTPADLGFKELPSLLALNTRAQELGLKLCPAEVGPQLRKQYIDQPKGGWIDIGMEPILDKRGFPIAFCVIEEEGVYYLHSSYNEYVQAHSLKMPFVYVKG